MAKIKAKLAKNYRFKNTEELIAHLTAVLEMSVDALDDALDEDIGYAGDKCRDAYDEGYFTLEALKMYKFK